MGHEEKITAAGMKFLRKILGKISGGTEREMEVYIPKLLKQEPITRKIEQTQLRWYEYIIKMRKKKLVRKIIEAENILKRRKGRPRKTG